MPVKLFVTMVLHVIDFASSLISINTKMYSMNNVHFEFNGNDGRTQKLLNLIP